MATITLTELKNILNINGSSKDTELGYAVDATNDYIDRVTSTTWGTTATATDELHDYAPVIFLNKVGVNSITAVKIGYGNDYDTLTASDYRFNKYGRLMLSFDPLTSFSHYDFDEVKVTYVYGYATVPDDLKHAGLLLASMAYDMGLSSGRSISREKIGSREIEYSSGDVSVFDIIESYGIR